MLIKDQAFKDSSRLKLSSEFSNNLLGILYYHKMYSRNETVGSLANN